MTATDELKPCPFCGGTNVRFIELRPGYGTVGCGTCCFDMPSSDYMILPRAEAIAATLGRGTCNADKLCDGYLHYTSYRCRGCGERFAYRPIDGKGRGASPKFCPNCGRRIEEVDW